MGIKERKNKTVTSTNTSVLLPCFCEPCGGEPGRVVLLEIFREKKLGNLTNSLYI
jgi:hypothetical protein